MTPTLNYTVTKAAHSLQSSLVTWVLIGETKIVLSGNQKGPKAGRHSFNSIHLSVNVIFHLLGLYFTHISHLIFFSLGKFFFSLNWIILLLGFIK